MDVDEDSNLEQLVTAQSAAEYTEDSERPTAVERRVTETTTVTVSSTTPEAILAPMVDSLKIRPSISFSPVGMAMSMMDAQKPTTSDQASVQPLLTDSSGISHYHRPVGILQPSIHSIHSIHSIPYDTTGDQIGGIHSLARQIVLRNNAAFAASAGRSAQRRSDGMAVMRRAMERVAWRLSSLAPKYSHRLDTLRSEHARRFQWHRDRQDHLRRQEIERMERLDRLSSIQNNPWTPKPAVARPRGSFSRIEELEMTSDQPDDNDQWVSDDDYVEDCTQDDLSREITEITERIRRRAANTRRPHSGAVHKNNAARTSRRGRGTCLAQAHARHTSDEITLRRAVYELGNGDVEAVLRMVSAGMSVDLRDSVGRTPLHIASASGNVEVVRVLIHLGADVNALDRVGNTPLTLAATSARADIILPLLEGGADPRVGQGVVSAMTMVRSRLRMLRMQIQQARMVERAATGALSDLVPHARERRRQAASVAKECIDVIHMLRHYIHRRVEEDEEKEETIAKKQAEESQSQETPTQDTMSNKDGTEKQILPVFSNEAASELDSLSAQFFSLGITENHTDKGKDPETQNVSEDVIALAREQDDRMDFLLEKFSRLLDCEDKDEDKSTKDTV
ncbi:hypothetical protein GGI07_002819 [Coemansia sp. Benny D115]|nr:hypothetical protein GGI07_002819 [Coemansia sp. Benny D115]